MDHIQSWLDYNYIYLQNRQKKDGGVLEELDHITQKMVVIRIMASNTRESCDQWQWVLILKMSTTQDTQSGDQSQFIWKLSLILKMSRKQNTESGDQWH